VSPDPHPADDGLRQDRPAEGVLRLTLDRPAQRNALTVQMASELRAAVAGADSDRSVRVVIVTSSGPAFCAGADLGALGSGAGTLAERRSILAEYYRAFLDLRDLRVPTIAAVHGAAIGAGLNLALCCDLRILSREARLAAPFLKLGIHPGGGCSWLLTRIAGTAAARELLLLGEPVGAERAFQLGLASELVEPEELQKAAVARAVAIALLPGPVVRDLKQTLGLAEAGASFEATLAVESAAQAESMATEDAREGWAAFRERRQPSFHDR
jgi:enoyl-CoA hydratase